MQLSGRQEGAPILPGRVRIGATPLRELVREEERGHSRDRSNSQDLRLIPFSSPGLFPAPISSPRVLAVIGQPLAAADGLRQRYTSSNASSALATAEQVS